MGKSFKRRWNKARIQKLKARRNPVDDLLTAGAAAAETVKEIVQTLSEPETVHDQPYEMPVAVEETPAEPAIVAAVPKKRRRRRSKTTAAAE